MQSAPKPAPKVKVALTWLVMVGVTAFWVSFFIWRSRNQTAAPDSTPDLVRSVLFLLIGAFFLMAGVAAYFIVILTNCFTFDFARPVFKAHKVKLYVANILVPLIPALGLGFLFSAFLTPPLLRLNLNPSTAGLLPVLVMVGLSQVVQFWVLVWAPLEKRFITKRLQARGISAAQVQTGFLVGISNAGQSSLKKFGGIEDDMGALWVGPDQLVYWGDNDQFAVNRGDLEQIERKADSASTSMLGGIMHVILHVKMPDGSLRQIQLHTEGLWTWGQRRRAMDALGEAIARWHTSARVPPPVPVSQSQF